MRMNENTASRVQYDIYMVTADETSTSAIGIASGSDVHDWVYAVNLIYRCLVSGIWTTDAAPGMLSWLESQGLSDSHDFCKKLSKHNPFVCNDINMLYWMGPLLCNTDFGQSFIESFGLENLEKEEPYSPFINALEQLFDEKGVPWEAGDLFGMGVQLD